MSTADVGKCPKCGSNDLDYDNLLFDMAQEMVISHEFSCNGCGAEGKDCYTIEFIGTKITKEKESNVTST